MPFRTTMAVHDNQCAVTKAKCVKRVRNNGYEMRTYISPTPFEVLLFDIMEDRCEFSKEHKGVRYGRGN